MINRFRSLLSQKSEVHPARATPPALPPEIWGRIGSFSDSSKKTRAIHGINRDSRAGTPFSDKAREQLAEYTEKYYARGSRFYVGQLLCMAESAKAICKADSTELKGIMPSDLRLRGVVAAKKIEGLAESYNPKILTLSASWYYAAAYAYLGDYLPPCEIEDDALVAICQNFKDLKRLELDGCSHLSAVSDLQNLKSLVILNLTGTNSSDLTSIKDLPLEVLKISSTQVVDLTPIQKMGTLRVLWLNETPVTTFESLKDLENLKKLHVRNTLAPLNTLPTEHLKALEVLEVDLISAPDLLSILNLQALKELDATIDSKETLFSLLSIETLQEGKIVLSGPNPPLRHIAISALRTIMRENPNITSEVALSMLPRLPW